MCSLSGQWEKRDWGRRGGRGVRQGGILAAGVAPSGSRTAWREEGRSGGRGVISEHGS
jgi:hypothetical protein